MASEIKFIASCGTGINASHKIKEMIEAEMKNRGYNVSVDPFMSKDVTESLLENYSGYLTIADPELSFTPEIPVIDAGAVLYGIPAMATPVYDKVEKIVQDK